MENSVDLDLGYITNSEKVFATIFFKINKEYAFINEELELKTSATVRLMHSKDKEQKVSKGIKITHKAPQAFNFETVKFYLIFCSIEF